MRRGFFKWANQAIGRDYRIASGVRFVYAEIGTKHAHVLDWASADQATVDRAAFERHAVEYSPRVGVVRRCLKRVPRESRTLLAQHARRFLDGDRT